LLEMPDSNSTSHTILPYRAYRAQQIADITGVDVRRVRRALHSGLLPRACVDHWLRAWGADVLLWVAEMRDAQPDAPPPEAAIRERVAAQVRREQAPAP
jgi:hypothetical protein